MLSNPELLVDVLIHDYLETIDHKRYVISTSHKAFEIECTNQGCKLTEHTNVINGSNFSKISFNPYKKEGFANIPIPYLKELFTGTHIVRATMRKNKLYDYNLNPSKYASFFTNTTFQKTNTKDFLKLFATIEQGPFLIKSHDGYIGYSSNELVLLDSLANIIYDLKNESNFPLSNYKFNDVAVGEAFIWVASNKGLIRIEKFKNQFLKLLEKSEAPMREITSIGYDSLLLLTERGAYLYRKKQNIARKIGPGYYVREQTVNNKIFLFPTINNLIYLDKRTLDKVKVIKLAESDTSTKNLTIIDGALVNDKVMLLMTHHALYTYDLHDNKLILFESIPESKYGKFRFFYSLDDILYTVMDNNIMEFDKESFKLSKSRLFNDFKLSDISHIAKDKADKNVYWVSCKSSGLYKLNIIEKSIKNYGLDEGLLSLNVHCALEDSNDKLWVSTDYGVSILDKNSDEVTTLTSIDGTHYDEFNRHSYYVDSDSNFYFGGLYNVIKFIPSAVELNFIQRHINIESINFVNNDGKQTINFNNLNQPSSIELDYNSSEIEINLKKSRSTTNNNIQYQLLSERSANWRRSDNRIIKLDDFAENDVLFIRYKTSLNEWSTPMKINLSKVYPFYKKKSFYISLAGLLGLSILSWSITSQRRIRKRNLKIKNIVKQQTEELTSKILELKRSNILNDRLFSIIGHDLRAPLIALYNINKNYNYLLKKQDYTGMYKLGENIEKNSQNLVNTVDRVLEWSNSLRKDTLSYSEFTLIDLFNDVHNDLNALLLFKNISLKPLFASNIILNSDRESVAIILRNLIHNSIKFSLKGSEILITYYSENDCHHIEVADKGVGITYAKIKEFNNGKSIISNNGTLGESGLGIGLESCLILCKSLNGKIQLSQNFPRGTIARLVLPMNESRRYLDSS